MECRKLNHIAKNYKILVPFSIHKVCILLSHKFSDIMPKEHISTYFGRLPDQHTQGYIQRS